MSTKIPAMDMFRKTTKADLEPNQYNFFLDAWLYCYKNQLPLDTIKRVRWDVWEVVRTHPVKESSKK